MHFLSLAARDEKHWEELFGYPFTKSMGEVFVINSEGLVTRVPKGTEHLTIISVSFPMILPSSHRIRPVAVGEAIQAAVTKFQEAIKSLQDTLLGTAILTGNIPNQAILIGKEAPRAYPEKGKDGDLLWVVDVAVGIIAYQTATPEGPEGRDNSPLYQPLKPLHSSIDWTDRDIAEELEYQTCHALGMRGWR